MSRSTWGFSQWLLMVLAAGVVAAYFGALGPVVDTLEDKVDVIEKKIGAKLDTSQAHVRARLERLGNQPRVQEKFVDTETAWVDALVVLTLFVFLTPIAVVMALILLVFLLSAIAHTLPLPAAVPHRAVVLVLAVGVGIVIYMLQNAWVPFAEYYAGWVARAVLVVTSG